MREEGREERFSRFFFVFPYLFFLFFYLVEISGELEIGKSRGKVVYGLIEKPIESEVEKAGREMVDWLVKTGKRVRKKKEEEKKRKEKHGK